MEWSWNVTDLVVGGVLLFGIVGGMIKGFTWQVVRLVFLAIAILVSGHFCAPIGEWFGQVTGEKLSFAMNKGIAYSVLFGAIYLGSLPLAFLLRSGIAKLKLKSYDRALGSALGLLKSTAVAYVALLLILFFGPRILSDENRLEQSVRTSYAYSAVSWANPTLEGLLPEEFHERVRVLGEEVDRKINENRQRRGEPERQPRAADSSGVGSRIEPGSAAPAEGETPPRGD